MKVLMISLISVLGFSCASPTNMRDRVESCMFRLVEQQGIAPLELEPRQGIEKTK